MKPEIIIGIIILLALGIGGFFILNSMPYELDGISSTKSENSYKEFDYREIESPGGYVNSDPFTIGQYVGEKVILLDVMTYSCINCQRTFPYLKEWYEKYEDDGFIIIGIHTPEFAFEKKKENVEKAMKEFGLDFPIVLDNEYATWNAYGNRYWPRKYLIDINGKVVYDHIGEGDYDVTEKKIQELLEERREVLGLDNKIEKDIVKIDSKIGNVKSPETYFGASRNEYLENSKPGKTGKISTSEPSEIKPNSLYLVGDWNIGEESASSLSQSSKIVYMYSASKVHLVMSSAEGAVVGIYQDGEKVKDVSVSDATLYTLIDDEESGDHKLEIRVESGFIEAFAFTFG